jgi:hypothetical protein
MAARKDPFDHRFRAIPNRSVPWQDEEVKPLLNQPEGVKIKLFHRDPGMKRLDFIVKFPKGHVEGRHTHKSWHTCLVMKGRVIVDGKTFRPGDYVFGWTEPHGPLHYPDGAEIFVVFMGEGSQHEWVEPGDVRRTVRAESRAKKGAAGKKRAAPRRKTAQR